MKSQLSPPSALRPTSIEKRRAIVDAALRAFIRDGLHAANLDDIAREAGVSKQTLYSHFGNKKDLFGHVVVEATTAAFEVAHVPADIPEKHTDLGPYFIAYGKMLAAAVLNPTLIGLRRLVIREAKQFPELAASFYDRGPKATQEEMAARIQALHERNLLYAPDPLRAASILNWLVLGDPLNRAMMVNGGLDDELKVTDAYIEEAVRVFLAAFATSSM